MTMTSPMMPAVTYVLWVRRWLRRLIRARKCLHKWIIWCQQTSMRCCMTKRDLRIRQFPFVRFLTTGSAPSLMRLRHFNLSWVSSLKFNWDQRSNQESISDHVTVMRGRISVFKGFNTSVKGVFGAYEWLAISLARKSRTKGIFPQK